MINTRDADLVNATATLRMQKQQLAEAMEDLKAWKLEFKFKSDPHTGALTIYAQKPEGGKAASKTLDLELLAHYNDDGAAVLSTLADDFYEFLLKEQIIAAMAPRFLQAQANSVKIMGAKK